MSEHPADPSNESLDALETLAILTAAAGHPAAKPHEAALRELLDKGAETWGERPVAPTVVSASTFVVVPELARWRSDPASLPPERDWDAFVRVAEREGLTDLNVAVAVGLAWPCMSEEARSAAAAGWKVALADGTWNLAGAAPPLDRTIDWYVRSHIVLALCAFGAEPAPGMLDDALREKLRGEFKDAVAAFARDDKLDLLSETLVAYRCLAGTADEAYLAGVKRLVERQNEDGSFGPSPELPPARTTPARHTTLVAAWALALAR